MTDRPAILQEFRNILEHGGDLPGDDARRLCLEMAEENERLRKIIDKIKTSAASSCYWLLQAENYIKKAGGHVAYIREIATNEPTEGKQE